MFDLNYIIRFSLYLHLVGFFSEHWGFISIFHPFVFIANLAQLEARVQGAEGTKIVFTRDLWFSHVKKMKCFVCFVFFFFFELKNTDHRWIQEKIHIASVLGLDISEKKNSGVRNWTSAPILKRSSVNGKLWTQHRRLYTFFKIDHFAILTRLSNFTFSQYVAQLLRNSLYQPSLWWYCVLKWKKNKYK